MTRVLKFIVDGQVLKVDPNCSLDELVPGTENYIKAEFSFSPEWDGYTKVVEFSSALGREYPPQLLGGISSCMIPAEALKRRIFKIRVFGQKGQTKIKTNKITIDQNGGKSI